MQDIYFQIIIYLYILIGLKIVRPNISFKFQLTLHLSHSCRLVSLSQLHINCPVCPCMPLWLLYATKSTQGNCYVCFCILAYPLQLVVLQYKLDSRTKYFGCYHGFSSLVTSPSLYSHWCCSDYFREIPAEVFRYHETGVLVVNYHMDISNQTQVL